VLTIFNVYGQGAILGAFTSPMLPQAVHHGTQDYGWGGGTFNFVLSVHGRTQGGAKQHLLRRIPLLHDQYAAPPNIAVAAPVYVGLWCRPAEIVRMWQGNGVNKWITVAGNIVNLTLNTAQIRVDTWRARIFKAGALVQDLGPPKQFRQIKPDNSVGPPIAPQPNGSMVLSDVRSGFVYGWAVDSVPGDLSEVTLPVQLAQPQGRRPDQGHAR